MADITMCTQTQCPNASHCYRVQAKAGKWQSMAAFEVAVTGNGIICNHYIKCEPAINEDSTAREAAYASK